MTGARRIVRAVARLTCASVLLLPAPAAARQAAPVPAAQPAPLRVHLECDGCECDGCAATIPPPREWLIWTDSAPDVHVRIAVEAGTRVDAATRRVDLTFSGRGELAALRDILSVSVPAAAGDALFGAAVTHALELGLVRFAAATPLGEFLHVGFAAGGAGTQSQGDVAAGAAGTGPVQAHGGAQSGSRPPQGGQARQGGESRQASQASQAREQKRWAAGLELGFSGSSGNSEFVALTTGVRVRHLQTNRFRLDWTAGFRYGESRGAVAARHTQSKLDFDLGPGARVAPYISVSGERDPFRRIDLRGRAGSGVRLALHKDEAGEASLRGGVLYTHERFSSQAAREPESDGMWSFKFTGNRQLFSSVRIENSSSFDPAVRDFGDYNLDVTSKLSTRVTRRVALTVSHTYAYDATPVAGVQPTDQRFQTGLTLDF